MAATVTAYLFACPELRVNTLASRHADVYGYEFADETAPGYLKPLSFPLLAAHTYELPYLFKGFKGARDNPVEHPLNRLQQELALKMIRRWTDSAQWKESEKFRTSDGNSVSFSIAQVKSRDHAYSRYKCGFWDSLGVY